MANEFMISTVQILVLLLVVVALSAVLANRLKIPPAILLVLAGVLLALVPGIPAVELAPEFVLLLVLPPIIYSSAVAMSWREFQFNLRPITFLAVIDSIQAVIRSCGAGTTKRQLAEALRREETQRGLTFEYCLVTTGTSLNREPSDVVWRAGEIASLDSGGNYKGYVGDLCRMAIAGEPDSELVDMLGEIEEIQQAARKPIKPGTLGEEIYLAAEPLRSRSSRRDFMVFVAHGMGLITHEAPRLSSRAPVPYPGDDGKRPLEEGMVISIETTLLHPQRGFIKLEDTIAVTASGYEAYGDAGRGWNIARAR